MFQKLKISLLLCLGLGTLVTPLGAAEPAQLASEKDRTSYAIGVQTARNFKKDGTDIDLDWVVRGLQDGLGDARPLLSDKEIKLRMQALMAEIRQRMAANKRDAAVKNKLRGEEFLAANKTKADVKVLASGVQYRVLKTGEGAKPRDEDVVLCNYRGTLLDGSEFDATLPDRPAPLKLAQMIPGWRDALKQMSVGSKWQLFVPPALAYGDKGVGNEIGPNEVLVFDVELLEIKK